MDIFFSNQGGGIIEKHRFLFKLLAFYSTEIIKFYSTLKMSLSHAEKVSCHLKQNQGVASLTNFCDAEPIRKKISYGEDRRNYRKFFNIFYSSSVRYFEFEKQQKEKGKIP